MSKIEDKVCCKIQERAKFGKTKYGVTLESAGLSALQLLIHAQEEAMDLVNYLETLIQQHSEFIENVDEFTKLFDDTRKIPTFQSLQQCDFKPGLYTYKSIDSSDIIIETFNSGYDTNYSRWGNQPETGVRITHVPTGIKAEASERGNLLYQNKQIAFERLLNKLNGGEQ